MTPDQRQVIYAGLFNQAMALHASGGVVEVAQALAIAILDTTVDDDLTFMRISALIRSEGSPHPTVPFLTALLEEVSVIRGTLPSQRAEMISDMLTVLSMAVCQDLVSTAMATSRSIAKALGASIEITAEQAGHGEMWESIDSSSPNGATVH